MKALKKAWIFLLLVCLTALFSTTALAANTTSGTCGDNVTWVLEDGVLTISGTGAMEDYSSNFDIPWYSQRTSITSVIIEEGVTTIGDWAFRNCDSLTSVTIPDSVTSIGNSAFAYCETLENVTIPDSVISIGKQAFLECGIKTITIPGSVTDIGAQAFAYCSQLAEISVSTDNPVYCSVDGVLFDKDKTELLCYSAGKESFSCSYEVPDGVTKIGDCSFQACRILEEVILPDGITSIGEAAFNYCSITRMTLPDGVISIGNGAFEACGELTSITIPDSVTFIDDIAFDGCSSLTDVYYGGSETEWNAIYIGINNDCLIYDATIHYNSTGAGSTGDTGDTGDTDDADDTDTMSGTCGENATWTLEGGVLTISGTGDMADYSSNFDIPWYSQRTSITSVIIEEGVTTIGDWAFRNCDSLTSMAISNSVTSIGNASFGNCNSLTSVTIPDSVTSIGNSAFAYCETLENVTIPDSIISIGKQAFLECGIKTITIPGSVTDIGTQAFAYCSQLAEISVSTDNPVYCSADGVLFDKDKTELLCYPAGKESFSCSYEVPDGVTKIGDCSFQACRILEEVILPDGITSIGEIAFNYCSITRMTLPDGVISIGNGAFEACGELTNITIPDSVTFIDDIAFSGCDSLTDVYYGGSETEWNAIYIGSDNDCLIYNATIHYNSTGSGSTDDTGDTGDTEATVSETLAAISETATETEIKTAVQAIAADELAAELSADTGDTGVTAQLAALEEQAGVTTSVTVADALAGSFDSSAVTVTGGALNTTTGDAVLTLSAAESADGSAYNNALAFSLTLTGDGVDSHALTVPVKITLPVPATHDPETLVLLHYADGENPVELETTIYESGTQWYVSFVLTSFSDFVMYDSSEVEISTLGDLNGDGEVNASDLTILARHVGKVEYITDETALANADVTGDGNVDASDLTKLAQYVGKIISSLD